jgi:hypothetical protein
MSFVKQKTTKVHVPDFVRDIFQQGHHRARPALRHIGNMGLFVVREQKSSQIQIYEVLPQEAFNCFDSPF